MAAATEAVGGDTDIQDGKFWKVPLPPQCIHFVDSTDSEAFSLLFWALRNSNLVAMDAEWKPVYNKSANAGFPRVSILQIACRLRAEAGACQSSSDREDQGVHRRKNKVDLYIDPEHRETQRDTGSNSSPGESCAAVLHRELEDRGGKGLSHKKKKKSGECDRSLGSPKAHQRARVHSLEKGANWEEKHRTEMIFLLDLLAIPASAFGRVLKDVLVDSTVLKLGFGLKQDLMNLRSTFPGPDSHGCFDKVDPYLDVGKLYRHLHENTSSYMYRGKKITVGGDGLASISESVLGLPLSKDMQCSNWEQRPLSQQQYDYAAADAYCLLAIFDTLQVKASDSWFAPVESEEEDDDDDEAVVEESQSKVGVAQLLSHLRSLSVKRGNSHGGSASICQPKRGNAANMVEAALGESNFLSSSRKEPEDSEKSEALHGESKTLGVEKLVRRFGEKLLITGRESSTKRARRKTRSRRAREYGKDKNTQDEEDVQWVGPPPWDSSVGGDGVPKFLCDAMVEGLARQLRCVGIDAASPNSRKCEPRELVDLAEKEGRILLTRDVKLLRRKLVPANLAYRVKRQGKWDQLAEVIEIFKLSISEEQLLTRCTKCNGDFIPKALTGEEAVAQATLSQVIPACALSNVDEFWQCSVCKHVYWQGYQFTRAYKQFAAVCQSDSSVVHD